MDVEPFPRDPQVFADDAGYGCNLPALFCAGWPPNRELAFKEYRSQDDTTRLHRAGVRWRAPVHVAAVHLRWPAGYEPAAFRVLIEVDDTQTPLAEMSAALTARIELPVGAAIQAVIVEQAPGGGNAQHPGVMRLAALSIRASATPDFEILAVDADGLAHRPLMPLATDGDPWTCLDLSDLPEIELRLPPDASARGLALDLVRIGSFGRPEDLTRWLAAATARAPDGRGGWRAVEIDARAIDTSDAGVVAGVARAALMLPADAPLDGLRLKMPLPRSALLAISGAALLDRLPDTPGWLPLAAEAPAERRAQREDPAPDFARQNNFSLDTARIYCTPLRMAASLGVPHTAPRVGVDADGHVQIQPKALAPHGDGHAQCLTLGARLSSPPTSPPRRSLAIDAPALTIERDHGPLQARQTLFVDPAGTPTLQWWIEVENRSGVEVEVMIEVGAALRDYLWALPLRLLATSGGGGLTLRWEGGAVALAAEGPWGLTIPTDPRSEWVLTTRATLAPGQRVRRGLRCPLEAVAALAPCEGSPDAGLERLRDAVSAAIGGAIEVALPDPEWGALVKRLMVQSSLFILEDERVPYGIAPSVYDRDFFGLEEDWLFCAWAQWGLGRQALASFKATYVQAEHLSKGHYLHDLRNGLTPWQAERLCGLTGVAWAEAFDAEERALMRSLGAWVVEQRALTAQATGAAEAGGWRTFPGLLPAFRYGGDLSFPTQSLFGNVANWVGLRALARVDGPESPWRGEVDDYRRAILAAFDAVKVTRAQGDFYPLDTGGGEAGSYYQLMAAGILDPMDFFSPGDPRADAIDAFMERDDRLCFGLPRFDDWGNPGEGVDAHYCVGYLIRALRAGRREVFWTGLCGLIACAMDPEVCTFREVSPIQRDEAAWGHDAHLPGRRLGRSEPCVGGIGVALQLIRHALVTELPEADGQPGRRLRFLAAPLPGWLAGPLRVSAAPTLGGLASIHVTPRGGGFDVLIDAVNAESIELQLPPGAGRASASGEVLTPDGRGLVALPPGRHRLRVDAP